jgi:hypothetical protein
MNHPIRPIGPPTNVKITRTTTIARLKAMGLPVLPVAPAQDAQQYPAKSRAGEVLREADGQPKPMFTGKNPSFLDRDGQPRLIAHRQFQTRLPHEWELAQWFEHPANGVMTMGGWHNIIWIDIDVKRYSHPSRCERSVQQWLARYPSLNETWIERTHSGGWRLAVQLAEMPAFSNFGFRRGQHIGEILGVGRLTVLAPTIGPSGNPYVAINRARPMPIQSVREIGLHTAQAFRKKFQTFKMIPRIVEAGMVNRYDLLSQNVAGMLTGSQPVSDRSLALTAVAREVFGWENWAAANGLSLTGQAEALIAEAAEQLEVDAERMQRILQGVDQATCQPAIVRFGGATAAWQKVKRVDQELYKVACPATIQQEIRGYSPVVLRQRQ